RRYTPRQTDGDKLASVFAALKAIKWSLSKFLYHCFELHPESSDPLQLKSHTQYVSHFLRGDCVDGHTPAVILDLWMRHPTGRLSCAIAEEVELLYSLDVPFTSIKSVR
ncbi:hypothetical protein OH77DRAFT_1383696, partial [Trametes cingulata]